MRALVLAALAAGAAVAQPVDTLAVPSLRPDSVQARSARGAVTRALLLPGLGQVYNRQLVKAPIAAALVAGAAVYAVDRQRRYLHYRRAAVYAGCLPTDQGGDPGSSPARIELCTEVAPDYLDEWEGLGSPQFAAVRPVRDRARGQRDVSVLIVAVAYAFQALDAYVFAELSTFDVSEDVAIGLDAGPGPAALSLRVRL